MHARNPTCRLGVRFHFKFSINPIQTDLEGKNLVKLNAIATIL
jgi:hypothetical protein